MKEFRKRRLIVLFASSLYCICLASQICGTKFSEEFQEKNDKIVLQAYNKGTIEQNINREVPVRIMSFNDSANTQLYSSNANNVNLLLSILNEGFINVGFNFVTCDNIINHVDQHWDSLMNKNSSNFIHLSSRYELTIIIVENISESFGYFHDILNAVVVEYDALFDGITLVHEVGHFFSLYHTHGNFNTLDELIDTYPDPNVVIEGFDIYEYLRGSVRTNSDKNADINGDGWPDCLHVGDKICDTNATPTWMRKEDYLNDNCVYTGPQKDVRGQDYENPETRNWMSYTTTSCSGLFTPDQIFRMQVNYDGRGMFCYAQLCFDQQYEPNPLVVDEVVDLPFYSFNSPPVAFFPGQYIDIHNISNGTITWENDWDVFEIEGEGYFFITVFPHNSSLASNSRIRIYEDPRKLEDGNIEDYISDGYQSAQFNSCDRLKYRVAISIESNIYCEKYDLRIANEPFIICNTASRNQLKDDFGEKLSCDNCEEFSLTIEKVESPFDNGIYNISAHLWSEEGYRYYNVYAVDLDGNLIGTTAANVRAKESALGDPNIVLENFPCGADIIFRAERVDDPFGCFNESVIRIDSCGTGSASLYTAWPGFPGQCFTVGETRNITWSSEGVVEEVDIYHCPFGRICTPLEQDYVNTDHYTWTVPNNVGPGEIKIEASSNSFISAVGSWFEIDDTCDPNACDPPIVDLLLPRDGAIIEVGQDFIFDWEASISEACQFNDYEIWFSFDEFFNGGVVKDSMTASSFGPYNTSSMVTLYWKVRIENDAGEHGAWSETRSLTTVSAVPDFTLESARTCSALQNGNECTNTVTAFDGGDDVHASIGLSHIQGSIKVLFEWKKSANEVLFTYTSPWHSFNDELTHFFASTYSISLSGSYYVDFSVITETGTQFVTSRSFTVSGINQSNAFGDLECVRAYTDGAGMLQVPQGSHFFVSADTEFDGDLRNHPNRRFEPRIGFYLMTSRSSDIGSRWNIHLGEENLSFRCSSFTLCDRVWEDSETGFLYLGYDADPGLYYVLVYVDPLNEWSESNENDNTEFVQIEVVANCPRIIILRDRDPTTTSVDLYWDENANVDSTTLRYRLLEDTDWTYISNFPNGGTLHNLRPCSEYNTQIAAHCYGEQADWSNLNYVATPCEIPCQPPTGRYENVFTVSASVYWEFVNAVYRYEVQWRELHTSSWTNEGQTGRDWERIRNLEAGTFHEWQVRSVCPGGEFSHWSSSRVFLTESSCEDGIQNGLETGIDCGGDCLPCDCEEEYLLVNDPLEVDATIQVERAIQASSSVDSNVHVALKAGNSIVMKPGTHIIHSSVVNARIDTCAN